MKTVLRALGRKLLTRKGRKALLIVILEMEQRWERQRGFREIEERWIEGGEV
jgi:hypothetical protein